MICRPWRGAGVAVAPAEGCRVAQSKGRDDRSVAAADQLARLSRTYEAPAEAAEQAVWAELVAGQRPR